MMNSTILLNVNGKDLSIINADPLTTLAQYLRKKLGLTGTKLGCEEGACGSCTVVLGRWSIEEKKAHYYSVNACLVPIFFVHGCFIITIEGIGSSKKIHPLQERMAKGHATQCGFCSPGFVMAAYALLRNNPNPSIEEINQAVKGNFCRCTGYRPILEALYSFSGCCKGENGTACPCKENGVSAFDEEKKLITFESFPKYDASQEIIFPPSLIEIHQKGLHGIELSNQLVNVKVPTSLNEFYDLRLSSATNTIISSGMISRYDLSLSKKNSPRNWLSLHLVPKFSTVIVTPDTIIVGPAVSISGLYSAIQEYCSKNIASAAKQLFDKYSAVQVMNLATWAGALSISSGSSDFCSLALALNWKILILREDHSKVYCSISDYISQEDRSSIIMDLYVPRVLEDTHIFAFKQGHRPGPDATVVNSVFCITGKETIHDARIVYGLDKYRKPLLALNLMKSITNRKTKSLQNSIEELLEALDKDLVPFQDLKDFEYKRELARGALKQFCESLSPKQEKLDTSSPFQSLQIFKRTSAGQSERDGCGRPLSHYFSDRSTTGEAIYIDDMKIKDLLHGAIVTSSEAHAEIVSIDPSEAMNIAGVVGYFDIKDLPSNGINRPGLLAWNFLDDDTPAFADGKVEYIGQPIGVIVAEDVETARKAARFVHVEYKKIPALLTIEEAIAAKSWIGKPFNFGQEEDKVVDGLSQAENIIEGEVRVGGQEHLYMEPQSAVVVPMESDEWVIHSSTQAAYCIQMQSAALLGISANKVVVKVKRLGGAFGGKAAQSFATVAHGLVAARILNRPVSVILHRTDDMHITGKRHPALIKYKVGFTKEGKLSAGNLKLYLDAGPFCDHSAGVTAVSASVCDCVYTVPVMRVEGYTVKTNKTNNTAFRSYGFPQAFFAMESIIHRIAHAVGKTYEEVKFLNFKDKGGSLLNGSIIRNEAMLESWHQCRQFSNFDQKRKEVEEFNRQSTHIKRGVAMTTSRFGLTHSGVIEQGRALVQLHVDGSVNVSIGGAEMGQGLNVKCMQIASRALGVPFDKITILDLSTDKTSSNPETGGSQGSDLCGAAVKACCDKLMLNIRPILKEENDWIKALLKIYNLRLPLQASESIRINRSDYEGYEEGKNNYFTTGAGCVLAEIDTRTGEHKLLSVDIIMDVGESLNPAVDIGQIEGGFFQGYGLYTTEELEYDEKGKLLTDTAYKYKAPTPHMAPSSFRVKLLRDAENFPGQVYSSKGIGEPPFLLGLAAYSAIRKAIDSHRAATGLPFASTINSPLTAKQILKLCNNE